MRTKHFALTAALLVLAIGMTACGKRGPLEPPPRADKTAHVERAAAESGKVIDEREQDVKESHEPFILDVLL